MAIPILSTGLIWVGLWYTVNDKELSASGVTKVSRKGMPSITLSTFNCKLNCWNSAIDMLQKILFMGPSLDDPCVIHKPIPKLGGIWGRPEGFPLKMFHV